MEAILARGRAYQKLGEFKPAVDDYLAVRKQRPSAELTAAVGYCSANLHQDAVAVKYYQDALADGASTVAILNNLGVSFDQLRRPQEAQRWLTDAIRLSPDAQPPFVNRALLDVQLASSNEEYVPTQGLEDIHLAPSKSVPKGASFLFYIAALLSAIACQRDESSCERTVDFLDRAVDYGLDLGSLRNHPRFSMLTNNTRFLALFQRSKRSGGQLPSRTSVSD